MFAITLPTDIIYDQKLHFSKFCSAGMRTFTWKVSTVNKSHLSSQMSQRVHLHSYDVPHAGENTFIFPRHPCSELHVTLNRLFGWDDEMLAQVIERERERESLGGNRQRQQMVGTVYNVIYYWHKQKVWADAILPDKLTFAVWVCVCLHVRNGNRVLL